jgi:hypothetical protein
VNFLCPTTYKWVDAAKAQAILMEKSPRHHCCTLYEESYRDVTNGSNGTNGTDERQATTLSTTEVVNQLRLDVGASTLVTLNMLQGGGQAVARPLLEEFVKEMGPELSSRFILKLV